MAGILEGLDVPKWMMTPGEWSLHSEQAAESIGRNVSGAVGHVLGLLGMMQNAQQAKDTLALKTREFEGSMEIDRGKLKIGEEKIGLQQKAQLDMMRDQSTLMNELDAYHSGKPLDERPLYLTKTGQAARDKAFALIDKNSADHFAELDINRRYGEIVSTFSKSKLEFDAAKAKFGAGSPEWNDVYDKWSAKLDEHNAMLKHPTATGPVTAFQLRDEQGNVIPNSPWVYHGENGAVHVVTQKPDAVDKEKELQRKFEMSRLGKQIDEANKALAADPKDPALKARVDELNRQKETLFKSGGAPSPTADPLGLFSK